MDHPGVVNFSKRKGLTPVNALADGLTPLQKGWRCALILFAKQKLRENET
jgi:hypothetical protein